MTTKINVFRYNLRERKPREEKPKISKPIKNKSPRPVTKKHVSGKNMRAVKKIGTIDKQKSLDKFWKRKDFKPDEYSKPPTFKDLANSPPRFDHYPKADSPYKLKPGNPLYWNKLTEKYIFLNF